MVVVGLKYLNEVWDQYVRIDDMRRRLFATPPVNFAIVRERDVWYFLTKPTDGGCVRHLRVQRAGHSGVSSTPELDPAKPTVHSGDPHHFRPADGITCLCP